jgi:hypothetical protein
MLWQPEISVSTLKETQGKTITKISCLVQCHGNQKIQFIQKEKEKTRHDFYKDQFVSLTLSWQTEHSVPTSKKKVYSLQRSIG